MKVDDTFVNVLLPEFQKGRAELLLKFQENSSLIKTCKVWVLDHNTIPDKTDALQLNAQQLSVIKHIDFFRVNKQGIIFRLFIKEDGTYDRLIWVENESLDKIILDIHEKYGHVSSNTVYRLMSNEYYATGMVRKIKDLLKLCVTCLKYNEKKTVKEKPSTQLATQPRQILSMDLLGPLPMSHGKKYIFAARDVYSRESFLVGVKSTSAEDVAGALLDIFETNGVWSAVQVDGRCVTQQKIDHLILTKLGVKIRQSFYTSHWQSHVERLNKIIVHRMLKMLSDESTVSNWSKI